jgi:dihydroorotate dehydrogenase electron transfer subunit
LTSDEAHLFRVNGKVLTNRQVGKGLFHMDIKVPEIAAVARPGQFVELVTGEKDSVDPLLRRPISIYAIDRKSGSLGIVYRVVGRGTQWLSERQPGGHVDIFGPVGNGFRILEGVKEVLLVAGGIGMPPLYGLAQNHPEINFTLYYGAQRAEDIILLEEWAKLGVAYHIATDDGSMGFAGRVTDLLPIKEDAHYDLCCACGPKPMLKAVQKYLFQTEIPGLLSLEERMACGVGACLGCVCKTRDGYRRVCVDGPVFASEEVIWE